MERSQKTSGPSDSRGGRVQPIFMVPPVQSPHGSRESAVSSSSARNTQDRGRADWAKRKGVNQDDVGVGHWLLNMMRKTLMVSENKELEAAPERSTLVPFGDVVGCLAVHIKNCRHFLPMIYLKHYTNLYIRISINNFVKYTKSFSLPSGNNEKNIVIKFEEMKFFSIQVPRHQDDKRNDIFLALVQYSDTENCLLLLGSVKVHLYEVIQKMCFTEELQMLNENTCVCRLDVEFMFAYGSFGYGFSHQLKPLQRHIEPTMFLNVASDRKRTDPPINVVTPQPVTFGNSADGQHPSQPSVVQLEKPRERLEKMKKEYRNLSTWKEKADYLESILNPELEHKDSKEININKIPGNPHNNHYEKVEDTTILDVPFRRSEAETIPVELLKRDDKKDLTIPTLNLRDQDNSIAVAPRTDESTPSPRDTVLSIIPTLKVTGEGEIAPSDEQQSKAMLEEKMKNNTLLPPVVKLKNIHPGILKTDSSSAKIPKFTNKASFDPFIQTIDNKVSARSNKEQETYKNRNILLAEDIEYEDQDPPYSAFSKTAGYLSNTWAPDPNIITKTMSDIKNGPLRSNEAKSLPIEVAFSPKEQKPVCFKPEFTEFIPKYQIADEASFDPFLENINNKIPARSSKEGDMNKYRNILLAEDLEYEEQDPPYAAGSKTAGYTSITRTSELTVITKKRSDTKNKLFCDPAINTTNTSASQKKSGCNPDITAKTSYLGLKERPPSGSLSSLIGESSTMRPENKCHPSKSLSPPSQVENLKQPVVLKSVLSKNLENLTDMLFSKSEICKNTEAIERSFSPFLRSIPQKPSQSLEDKGFKSTQDLHTWLSEKDILNSKTLLCKAIKNISADLLAKGKPGKSPEAEGSVSEKHLEAHEINFPMKKKNTFKNKYLICEMPSYKSGSHSDRHDCIIKELFVAPMISQLEADVKELSETDVNWQGQLLTPQERSLSSRVPLNSGEKDDEKELPQSNSLISQIIRAFPIDAILQSGINKVIELGKENQMRPLLSTEGASPEKEPKDSTVGYSDTKSKTKLPSGQKRPIIPKATAGAGGGVELTEASEKISLQDSKYHSTAHTKPDLTSKGQRLNREENDLNCTLESLSNPLMETFNESEARMLICSSKSIFNVSSEGNQSERRQPGKELQPLTQHSYPSDAEHFEEIQGNLNKADKKPILSPKLRVFLEELSESEVKCLKFELSKRIQHYLVERLSEAGHITKEDLPKIYQNLYSMNEKAKLKGQNFQDKYSETIKEIMFFINKFHHHFIDKHVEIKLRSFLNELLQNYFLKNFSECSLFNETESATTIHPNISSVRNKNASKSFYELRQNISRGSFDRQLEMNMKYLLGKSLQNYLIHLSETELLNSVDLSKHFQSILIELLKSGLITEKQSKTISQHINLLNSSSSPSKYIKTDLSFRSENCFLEEHSEKQNKCPKTGQNATLQKIPEDKHIETEFIRKEEKEYFSLHSSKENASRIKQQKNNYSREGSKTISLIKIQPYSNNIRTIPLNKSERLTGILHKKHNKDYSFMQPCQAENSTYKTGTQDPHSRDGKSKTIFSKVCFERKLKANPIEKMEYTNTYKLTLQKNPEAILSPFPRVPYCCMPREDDYLNSSTFSSCQANILTHFNFETKKQATSDQYFQRLKKNSNNKKHLVTFGQYQKDIQTLYTSRNEICNENCTEFPELQSFKYKEDEKNSKPFFFPEVLKRANIKPKVQKERKYASKSKKSSNNIGRTLPITPPTTTVHLRKSVPKTLLHWTARTTIHDCLDKYEDVYVTPVKHPTKTKSRTRLGKTLDGTHTQRKCATRPYTAPEPNKQWESYTGKFPSPRMVSAGLIHINDAILDHEMHKMWPPKIKRRY